MKANELTLGDYLSYNGQIIKVASITKKKVGYHIKENECRMHYARLCEYNPIPLIPEILEKNGFVKFIAGQYILPKGDNEWIVNIVPNLSSALNSNGIMLVAIKNIYTDAKIAISYVHELQHALRLCGITLNIEI